MMRIPLPSNIAQQVAATLAEDIGSGDLTADLIHPNTLAKATIITREKTIMAGQAWADEVFKQVDNTITIQWHAKDGDSIAANSTLCQLSGPARSLLTGERSALNFLQLLSGIATRTALYVEQVKGTQARILDTRKTLPGLRLAQKYAVLCGGGENHRIGLYDMILIKENHILAAGSITQAIQQARQRYPHITIEVETETLDEFKEASRAKADIIMLDEFSHDDLCAAVHFNQGAIPLEASGGVTLDTIQRIAKTGVDLISIGELTKTIDAIDLSLRFDEPNH